MKLRKLYKGVDPKKYPLRVEYDKKSKGRPAWIKIKGVPKDTFFIMVHLGKKGQEGQRIQRYQVYLPQGLFLPVNYTEKEMEKFYDKWASDYDKSIIKGKHNLNAGKFLLSKVSKYKNKGNLLDLGAGTGIITEMFVKKGFHPTTLIDFSQGMLNYAKKKKGLKKCSFSKQDVRNLKLNKKYDLITSFFSFGSSSYFKRSELDKSLGKIKKYLKNGGVIAILGHFGEDLFKKHFKTLESGIYVLNKEKKYYTDYYIGQKK
ncbi:methyltransferase domain-containing protein [Nanoarchaeota archaeon]